MGSVGNAGRSRSFGPLLVLPIICLPLGCHSAFINATVENHTGSTISPLEVDYPSASFGKESLPDGANFKYRFKVQGSGGMKIVWTDARHQDHTAPGPELHEGQEGMLTVDLSPAGAKWATSLKP